ncbi:MAG: hypothetical protein ACTSSH_12135, partial [Candidatus Heimdallarchaeota archaeon]
MAKESSCPNCGHIIDIGIFCPKCGSKLQLDTTTDFGNEIREHLIALHKLMDKFRFKIYKKLAIADERILLNFRASLEEIELEYGLTPEILAATKKTSEIDSEQLNLVLCPRCRVQVKRGKFCPKCGSQLEEGNIRKLDSRIYRVRSIIQNYQIFMRNIQDTLTEELVTITGKIDSLLKEILDKLTRQHNNIIDTMKTRQIARVQQPAVITRDISAPIPVSGQRVHKIGQQVIPVAAHAPSRLPEDVSSSRVIPTQKKSFYSKFEKNLVNYWFFYLSIFLLTIGVILTVVFVVRDIPDVNLQLVVIYSIGGGILVIGELITILLKRRKLKEKIAQAKEKKEVQEDEDKESQAVEEPQERTFPLPQFATVIVFIGLLTIYTAGIIGFGSGLPRSIFTFVSFGVALLAVVLGVLNDSEMTTLTGFIPMIAFIFLDVSWGGGSSLNEIGMLLSFVIPIIIATIIGIFFNKWWGSIVLITVVPVALCIPIISTKMGLEFIPLIMIPLMTLLIVRFNKGKIPFTHKKILVFISQILPAIALGVISIPGFIDSSTEPAWAKIYPVEIIVSTAIILGIGFFYQFIQEKYLDIKSKNCVFYYLGQGIVGLISIIMVVTNLDNMNGFIYSIIYF